jgi:hypothetical protein
MCKVSVNLRRHLQVGGATATGGGSKSPLQAEGCSPCRDGSSFDTVGDAGAMEAKAGPVGALLSMCAEADRPVSAGKREIHESR